MARLLDPSSLVPAGFVVDDILTEENRLIVRAHSAAGISHCPSCGRLLVKRQMYGRAKIDLLQARLIGAL